MVSGLMTRRSFLMGAAVAAMASMLSAVGCAGGTGRDSALSDSGESRQATGEAEGEDSVAASPAPESFSSGTETYRGFTLDNVLSDPDLGDIHFNLHVPDGYDPANALAGLFVTLPGYQGLYFQGVGTNLRTEDFGFVAQDYDPRLIVCAPQLEDWGETSARKTIALVECLMRTFAVDPRRVLLEGYSGGGETLSLVMGMRPELFSRALFCSSQWDGDLSALAAARVPVYMVVGESDEYYGSGPAREAAEGLRGLYRDAGLSPSEIGRLVTLDVKDAAYFEAGGVANQHGGGGALFARDGAVMNWLFA